MIRSFFSCSRLRSVYVGTIETAFSALMELSLRLMAERGGRDDRLGYLPGNPVQLFIPVRLLLGLIFSLATVMIAVWTAVRPESVSLLSAVRRYLSSCASTSRRSRSSVATRRRARSHPPSLRCGGARHAAADSSTRRTDCRATTRASGHQRDRDGSRTSPPGPARLSRPRRGRRLIEETNAAAPIDRRLRRLAACGSHDPAPRHGRSIAGMPRWLSSRASFRSRKSRIPVLRSRPRQHSSDRIRSRT